MLTRRTQEGKRNCVHVFTPATSRSTAATRYPKKQTQRGMAEVRSPRVLTERVNTAAIRMAYVEMSVWVVLRPQAKMSACRPIRTASP